MRKDRIQFENGQLINWDIQVVMKCGDFHFLKDQSIICWSVSNEKIEASYTNNTQPKATLYRIGKFSCFPKSSKIKFILRKLVA